MNTKMHGKLIEYIDLNPAWTQSGYPERISSGDMLLWLSATFHGDRDEFWIIESLQDQTEIRRFNPRGVNHIKWLRSDQPT